MVGFFTRDVLAIDIGSYSVKGAVVSANKQLKKVAAVPTPQGAINGGVICNPRQIAESVAAVCRALGVKNQKVLSLVPGQHVFMRQIIMPQMKKRELAQAVRYEAEGQIPLPPADVVWDYAVVSRDKQAGQLEVLLVATRRSVVQQQIQMFLEAELHPQVLDLESLALARILLESKHQPCAGELEVIVSIGAANTHICVFEADIPRFTRTIPFGGQRFTETLAADAGISLTEAEQRKLQGELSGGAVTLMDNLAAELRLSVNFYLGRNKKLALKQLILTGGGANLPGLAEYLSNKLDVPVAVGNINGVLKIPKGLSQPADLDTYGKIFAPVLGLAVREGG